MPLNREIETIHRSGVREIRFGEGNSFNDIDPNPLEKRHFSDDPERPNGIIGLNGVVRVVRGYAHAELPEQVNFEEALLINAPHPPESLESGIGEVTELNNSLWYEFKTDISQAWVDDRVILHFRADHRATVFVNGQPVYSHENGFTAAECDIKAFLTPGKNTIHIHTLDDHTDPLIPKGKQSWGIDRSVPLPKECNYWTSSGINGGVYLIRKPVTGFDTFEHSPYLAEDNNASELLVNWHMRGNMKGKKIRTTIHHQGKLMGSAESVPEPDVVEMIPLKETHPWDPRDEKPALYDVSYELMDEHGVVLDHVSSKFGVKNFHIETTTDLQGNINGALLTLNGERVRVPGLLDQGYNLQYLFTQPPEVVFENLASMREWGFLFRRVHMRVQSKWEEAWCMENGIISSFELPNWNGAINDWKYIQNLRSIQHASWWQLRNFTSIGMAVGLNEADNNIHPSAIEFIAEGMKEMVGNELIRVNVTGFPHQDFDKRGAEEHMYLRHIYSQHLWEFYRDLVQEKIHKGYGDIPHYIFKGLGEFGGVRTEMYPADLNEAHNNPYLNWVYGTRLEIPLNEEHALRLMGKLWATVAEADIDFAVWTQLESTPPEFNGLKAIKNTQRLQQIIYLYATANEHAAPLMPRKLVRELDLWLLNELSTQADRIKNRLVFPVRDAKLEMFEKAGTKRGNGQAHNGQSGDGDSKAVVFPEEITFNTDNQPTV